MRCRHARRAAGTEVLAAVRNWLGEQPPATADTPATGKLHAELRAAAHLEEPTEA
ncbi:hypothetical protein [Paractinoplanes rishiriensis]|uniref:hypothetical protein n=1 Tax=Paractinoplanes rishiriensis TaxID=1050105 RepID=UPI001942594E|nr:hypothetical protein [Actinoplanes rishiriensis]